MRPPRLVVVCAASLTAMPLAGQNSSPPPDVIDQQLVIELLPDTKELRGTQIVRWTNTAHAATTELRFHLYWNAFRDLGSTFQREAGPEVRALWRPQDFGGLEVDRVVLVAGGAETVLTTEFAAPDDDNRDDRTVLRVALPRPVAPGASVTTAMQFHARAPKALRRWGWVPGSGFYCMHFHPEIGVLQDDGHGGAQWNCHQFHCHSEFFADFATFAVALTVPQNFVVGATGGAPVTSSEPAAGKKTLTFRQEHVHNFAFVADPDFIVVDDTFGPLPAVDDPTGIAQLVATLRHEDLASYDLPVTAIRLLLHPEHDTPVHRARYLQALRVGLEFYGLRYGSYPYHTITAVDPGHDVAGNVLGGGMEYPTLITLGTALWPHPQQLAPEGVTVHEFGHQYWYGLSANNEFEESWLDEGINTYSTGRALALAYQPQPLLRSSSAFSPIEAAAEFTPLRLGYSRGALVADGGLRPRPDLPLVAALPHWADAEAAGFRAVWLPQSPLLELLRVQPAVAWFPGVADADVWADRRKFLDAATPDPMVLKGWLYADRRSYSVNSYQRPATVLRTLERLVESREHGRWWAFLREFHQQSRYRHPTTAGFEELLAQRCGAEVADWFRATIAAGAVLDYGVFGTPVQEAGRCGVAIRRYGSLPAAVKVRFTFANGPAEYRSIAATELGPVWRFTFQDQPGKERGDLQEVWIDPPELPAWIEERAMPCGLLLLDTDLTNNAWRKAADPAPAVHRGLRALLQAQCELTFAGAIG